MEKFCSSTLDSIIELVNEDMLDIRKVLGLGLTVNDPPALINELDDRTASTEQAIKKIDKLITVFTANPKDLYSEYSAEDLTLLPRTMMLVAQNLTKPMQDYLFSNLLGIDFLNVDAPEFLAKMNQSFLLLHSLLHEIKNDPALQWGSDGSGFNYTAYDEMLGQIKDTAREISTSILPGYEKQVGWFSMHYSYFKFQARTWYLYAYNNFAVS